MENHGDPEKRRTIRYKYRTLLQKTQDDHQELIRPESDQLQKTLDEADKLFQDVKQPREAALDSQLLAAVSNLSKKKAQSLQADFVAFEPIEYAEKLMAYLSGNRLPDDRQKVNQDGWESLGEAVQSFFKRSPPLNFMFGSFERGPPKQKNRCQRSKQQNDKDTTKGPTAPRQLSSFQEAGTMEVTTEQVQHIHRLLTNWYERRGKNPICYFEFITNPHSFGQTIENIFYTSFLIRDGHARIFLDRDKLPVIEPVIKGNDDGDDSEVSHQVVMSLTKQNWLDIIKYFKIKTAMIDTREAVSGASNGARSRDK